MKKIYLGILITAMAVSNTTPALARNIGIKVERKQAENYNMSFTLDKAIEYALKNSLDLKLTEIRLKREKVNYDNAGNRLEDLQYTYGGNLSFGMKDENDFGSIQYEVTDRARNLSLRNAEINKEIKTNDIKYSVEKVYYDLLLAQQDIYIAENNLKLARTQFEQGKRMEELGGASKVDVLNMESAVSQAQVNLDNVKLQYDIKKMNFNNTIGLALGQSVVLTGQMKVKRMDKIDIEKSINESLDKNGSIKVARGKYELEEIREKLTPQGTYEYEAQSFAVEEALKSLQNTYNIVEISIRSAYHNLISAEKQISMYEDIVKKAEKSLELANLSFELGKNTYADTSKARIELMEANKNLQRQKYAYNLAFLDYNYTIGIGKGIN